MVGGTAHLLTTSDPIQTKYQRTSFGTEPNLEIFKEIPNVILVSFSFIGGFEDKTIKIQIKMI